MKQKTRPFGFDDGVAKIHAVLCLSPACRGESFGIESINKTSIVPNNIKQLLFGHMPVSVLFLLHRSSSKAAGFWVGMTPNQRSNWIPSTKQEDNYPLFEGWNLSWNAWSTPVPGRKSWSSHDITVISHAESLANHISLLHISSLANCLSGQENAQTIQQAKQSVVESSRQQQLTSIEITAVMVSFVALSTDIGFIEGLDQMMSYTWHIDLSAEVPERNKSCISCIFMHFPHLSFIQLKVTL